MSLEDLAKLMAELDELFKKEAKSAEKRREITLGPVRGDNPGAVGADRPVEPEGVVANPEGKQEVVEVDGQRVPAKRVPG